ncbi:hypothetical protein AX15_006209 [Amanita polypyramis BW_CC]|nr:hypothetical protein AX15_006209 [Amanita polypyramis BW_CC]
MPPSVASATTLKRIHREIADLKKEDLGPMTLSPSDDSLFSWKGTIPGPQGSVYEGGVFNIEIVLATDYPFSAPKVLFRTRIYHMNISEQGNICIDILKNNWSPALSLFKVMLSLSSLLTDPNPKDPLVPSIATQYLRNRKLHDSTAREWTEKYARPKPLPVLPLSVVTVIRQPPVPAPAPTPAPPASAPPISARARGKKPATELPTPASTSRDVGSSSTNARSKSGVIEVASDSDEEPTRVTSSRPDNVSLGKRKRNVVAGPESELVGSGEVPRSAKRRPITDGRGPQDTQDVIVIEDD